jgi:DNA-binding NarL/FixJ family response regulator
MAIQLPKRKLPKKIFVVDDHPVFREGLASLIRRDPGLAICGEASDAAQALTTIERLKPDVALVDISLPGRSGLELVKDLRAARPTTAILVISMHDETLYAERVLRAGARGYIMKQEGPEKMLRAIRQVLDGQIYLSSKMSIRILDAFSGQHSRTSSPIGRLTDRELEILELVGHGKDSRAIAKQLNLSFKTVDAHRGHIKEKLELRNHTELITYAAKWVQTQSATVA